MCTPKTQTQHLLTVGRSPRLLVGLVTLCGHLIACSAEQGALSEIMVDDAQSIAAIIEEHLDLRNGSQKNCSLVAGKLLGYLETHKASRLGLDKRLRELSHAERKELRARLAQRGYGAAAVRLKRTQEQLKQQCPVQAAALESLMRRIRLAQPFA